MNTLIAELLPRLLEGTHPALTALREQARLKGAEEGSRVGRPRVKGAGMIIAVGASALIGCTALAQEPPGTATDELLALDQAWINAEVTHDQAARERILDDRFLATVTSGATIDRAAFIERIMKANIQPFDVIHEVIRVHGDVALVIDTSIDRKTKYSWIAIKREGQWRVISETFTRVEAPQTR